jgi:hypothetical protein
VEFFETSLDSSRFTDSASERPFVEYLSALFRDHPLDLVVSIGGAANLFCLCYSEDPGGSCNRGEEEREAP